MTDLVTLKELLARIPGVTNAFLVRNDQESVVFARIRCADIAAIDVLAYCGMAANVDISVSEIASQLCGEPDAPVGLPCDIRLRDDTAEHPSETRSFGFFVARRLFADGLIDDGILNDLEKKWDISFRRGMQ